QIYAFLYFFFQAEDGIRDRNVTEFRRVLFRSTTLLRVRPEAINGIVGIGGYVIDNAMLATLDNGGAEIAAETTPALWLTTSESHDPSAEFSRAWLTAHTRFIEAETTSAITPFLTQNVS